MKQSKVKKKQNNKQKRRMPISLSDGKPSAMARQIFSPFKDVYGGVK